MNNDFIASLKKPRLLYRIWKRFLSWFYFEQWILLISSNTSNNPPSWRQFKPLLPPTDRFWADPFIWRQNDDYFIFYEELPYATNRGVISCITLDKGMNIVDNCVVLERPYHLSYPFIFEYEQQLYMIPETGENTTVELYSCRNFPNKWEFVKVLIPGYYAVDATLFEREGKWWLFANIAEESDSTWDTLYAFYADTPITDQWTPHPKNPIVKDVHSARPAGRIILQNGNLIRPSQDCSVRYGYALNFNHITTLTETDYSETLVSSFRPPRFNPIIATHTWNELGNLRAIDAQMWRRKFKSY